MDAPVDVDDVEGEDAVVDEDGLALVDDLGQVRVVDEHDLVVALVLVRRVGGDDHLVAGQDLDVLAVDHVAGADLGALGVEGDGERPAGLLRLGRACVVDDRLVVLVRAVREVHADCTISSTR